jgi:hypothetical protein
LGTEAYIRALFGKAVLRATGFRHFQGQDRAFQRDQGVSRLVASGHDTVRPLGVRLNATH